MLARLDDAVPAYRDGALTVGAYAAGGAELTLDPVRAALIARERAGIIRRAFEHGADVRCVTIARRSAFSAKIKDPIETDTILGGATARPVRKGLGGPLT